MGGGSEATKNESHILGSVTWSSSVLGIDEISVQQT